MANYKMFEDLKVWQDARELNGNLYKCLKLKNDIELGFLKNHILKTAGSIMDNIAEGFERGGNKELIQFLYISKGSAGELRSQFYRALDTELIDSSLFNSLMERVISISSQLSLFIQYLKKSELKGEKFNEPSSPYENELDQSQFFCLDSDRD